MGIGSTTIEAMMLGMTVGLRTSGSEGELGRKMHLRSARARADLQGREALLQPTLCSQWMMPNKPSAHGELTVSGRAQHSQSRCRQQNRRQQKMHERCALSTSLHARSSWGASCRMGSQPIANLYACIGHAALLWSDGYCCRNVDDRDVVKTR